MYALIDDELFQIRDSAELFPTQSISTVFTLTMAMQLEGAALWRRIEREPSGTAFNSLVQLEYENGIPRNPFINAGALVVTDIILTHRGNVRLSVLNFMDKLCNQAPIDFNHTAAHSERATGFRNAARGYFLKSFGNLHIEFSICVWSPGVNASGNSLADTKAIKHFYRTA